MFKDHFHAPKQIKLIYQSTLATIFSLISNGGFSWNLNLYNFEVYTYEPKSVQFYSTISNYLKMAFYISDSDRWQFILLKNFDMFVSRIEKKETIFEGD